MNTMFTWTGVEIRILRLARRMSVRKFAAHLGVSDRVISVWEAGGRRIRPREVNQAALDESLHRCTDTERRRFEEGLRALDTNSGRRQLIRWCLVVDVPPADVALAHEIAVAVNSILGSQPRRPSTSG